MTRTRAHKTRYLIARRAAAHAVLDDPNSTCAQRHQARIRINKTAPLIVQAAGRWPWTRLTPNRRNADWLLLLARTQHPERIPRWSPRFAA